MSGWSGFTDEELQRMKAENKSDADEETDSPINEPIKVAKLGRQQKKKSNFPRWDAQAAKPTNQKVAVPSKGKPEMIPSTVAPSSTPNADITVSTTNVNNNLEEPVKEPVVIKDKASASEERPDKEVVPETKEEVTDIADEAPKATKEIDEPKDVKIGVLSESEEQALEMSSLEQLQLTQKLIEDQNKKKQQLIQQRLHEKFKQTQNESQKLKEIHRELKLVDTTFQANIDGLRCKIDDACLAFSHAQKRYQRAEKEYVEAKLDYFEKKDKKDELTEQLYSIIQDNEVKKAKKLEELMTKLSPDFDTYSVSLSPPPSPITMVATQQQQQPQQQPQQPQQQPQQKQLSEPTPAVNGDATSNDAG